MTDDTLGNILDNDICKALEKNSILSDKSSINGVLNKDSEKLSNNTIGIFKSIITSAIDTIRGKSKRSDIDFEKRINI